MKEYKFRTLNASDIAPICSIISKIGLNNFAKTFKSEDVVDVLTKKKGAKDLTALAGVTVALNFANVVISHIADCENEIFKLLSSVSDLSYKEVKELDLVTFSDMIINFVKKEEFKDFFKHASKLFK